MTCTRVRGGGVVKLSRLTALQKVAATHLQARVPWRSALGGEPRPPSSCAPAQACCLPTWDLHPEGQGIGWETLGEGHLPLWILASPLPSCAPRAGREASVSSVGSTGFPIDAPGTTK